MTTNPEFKATLSTKNQLVVPSAIRTALNLRIGDEMLFRLTDGRVVVEKAGSPEDPFHHFADEWGSARDTKAYADL